MTITSAYGPPFNEGNWITEAWENRKAEIKEFLETGYESTDITSSHLQMLKDLWLALEAEESDNELYGLNLTTIYDEITGGRISIPTTDINTVLSVYHEKVQDDYAAAYEDGKNAGIAGDDI